MDPDPERYDPTQCLASPALVDWQSWQPRDRATLLFVVQRGRVLLIRKKRGLGAGKISGPGGRLEPGETVAECALREVREELGITALGAEQRGELSFQFTDGYSIHATVFLATDYLGEPQETDEAIPLWTALDAIPYDQMWADDALWLPLLLSGSRFVGRFVFAGDQMLSHDVRALV
ncbi:MAG: 8-oxo-dGTP diphosphatase [Polyangiaceae bacterium]|nr:8-oxo-dGTP diphosphatase [Polyangiaceae bacterium]